ncbi:MAG TPA: flagellar basal body protein [Candidatus Acidoferrales bacterium]|jgi:flagellar basal-body rod protein FlgB|nr:flagellar basal body protein [Candidatus Acidoferrales bacterium]
MSMIDTPNLNVLEHYLNLASVRQALISSNLANIDTPGYKTMDIDFHREMSRAMNDPAGENAPMVEQVQGLIERPDGNNVSVDRESLLLSQTQMQFTTAIQLMRAEFRNLTDAISGGA